MLTDNSRGALLMTLGMASFTANDACMKALSDELPLFQALFLRGIATCLILLVAARAVNALEFRLPPRELRLMALRTLGEIGSAYFFISALFSAPLANVTAILQALPLTVTLAAAIFLGEGVGWRRWLAILMGFVGVLLIVRPGAEGFNAASINAVIAVLCVTLRDLVTRQMSRGVPSMTIAFTSALGVTAFAAVGSLGVEWQPVSGRALGQLTGATVLVVAGYLTIVLAVRAGETGFVAPFRYTSLLWALVLGFLVFGEWPRALTLLGGAIVVASGVFTLYRERHAARADPVPLRVR